MQKTGGRKQTVSQYMRILTIMAINKGVLCSKTIAFLSGGDAAASRIRSRGLKCGHLRKTTIKKRERTEHVLELYELTQKGLDYLIGTHPFISRVFLPSDAEVRMRPDNSFSMSKTVKIRTAKINTVLALAVQAGAYVPHENYTQSSEYESEEEPEEEVRNKEENRKCPVSVFLREALSQKDLEGFGIYEGNSQDSKTIEFHSANSIKCTCAGVNSMSTILDFTSGRYGGVLDSKKKSVIVYPSPLFGMRWSVWITQRELAAYEVWRKLGALADTTQLFKAKTCAALIVDNSKQFANLYHDVDHVRITKEEQFGGAFDHFYILPQDENGVSQIKMIMNADDEEINAAILEDAIASEAYFKSSGQNAKLFPLINEDGDSTALGFIFDAKHLMRLESYAKRNERAQFILLCYPWQKTYYEAVLPSNVKVTAVGC